MSLSSLSSDRTFVSADGALRRGLGKSMSSTLGIGKVSMSSNWKVFAILESIFFSSSAESNSSA